MTARGDAERHRSWAWTLTIIGGMAATAGVVLVVAGYVRGDDDAKSVATTFFLVSIALQGHVKARYALADLADLADRDVAGKPS